MTAKTVAAVKRGSPNGSCAFPLAYLRQYKPKINLHIHSNYTDGRNSVQEMIDAAIRSGLTTICFTEHVRRSSDWFPRFYAEVNTLRNAVGSQLDIWIGTESALRSFDGSIDIADATAAQSEFRMASFHKMIPEFRPRNDQEYVAAEYRAIMAACNNKRVDVLGHPMGMSLQKRYHVPTEYLEAIVAAAKRTGKSIEINLKYHASIVGTLLDLCKRHDANVAVGGNSHSVDELASGLDSFYEALDAVYAY